MLRSREGSDAAKCIHGLLERDLSTLHNPTAERVQELFVRYVQVDVTKAWTIHPRKPSDSRAELNRWLKVRGDSIHRSPPKGQPVPVPHLVKKEDLGKAMRFFRALASTTESAVAAP